MTTQQTKVERARRIIAETYGRTRDERGTLMVGDGPARVEAIVHGAGDQYWEMRAVMAALSVAQPEVPTPSPELTARMVEIPADQAELLWRVLTSIGACVGTTLGHATVFVPAELVDEAREAATMFPEPVDPDLIEARRCAADWCAGMEDIIISGASDKSGYVTVALAAIKRGRALAEAGK